MRDSPYADRPAVKIQLCDDTSTWVTYYPVNGKTVDSVFDTVDEVVSIFKHNLSDQENAVEKHLVEFYERNRK